MLKSVLPWLTREGVSCAIKKRNVVIFKMKKTMIRIKLYYDNWFVTMAIYKTRTPNGVIFPSRDRYRLHKPPNGFVIVVYYCLICLNSSAAALNEHILPGLNWKLWVWFPEAGASILFSLCGFWVLLALLSPPPPQPKDIDMSQLTWVGGLQGLIQIRGTTTLDGAV